MSGVFVDTSALYALFVGRTRVASWLLAAAVMFNGPAEAVAPAFAWWL